MLISFCSDRGFTLIEVMVAMLIILVALLGLLEAVNIATEQNLRTQQRGEAVRIAEERIANFRVIPFDQISTSRPYSPENVPSRLRGVTKNYTVRKFAGVLSPTSKSLDVRVSWAFKNMSTTHEVSTIRTE